MFQGHTAFSTALLSLLFVLGTMQATFGQDRSLRGTVHGTVIDAQTDEPLPSATVALWSTADSTLVTGSITEADGAFRLENIRPGQYYVRVSFVGYQPEIIADVAISSDNREVDVGEVQLLEEAANLDEVEVSAERAEMEVRADRTIYNTREQPLSAGGSAIDVLETIPSIEVDINDNISLRGNENVALYLNGKPAPMSGEALTSFLNGLSADDVERVEVIPNPSARYEPEGMSGIINIVLVQDREGTWGGSVSTDLGTNGRYGASANLHYGTGPWSLYGNYGLRHRQRDSDGYRFRENRYADPLTYLEQDISGERAGFSHYLNTSVDYRLSEENTLSLSTILSQRRNSSDERNLYRDLNSDQSLTRQYVRRTDGNDTDFGMDYRLSFQRIIEPSKHQFSVEARYEQDQEDEFEDYVEELLEGESGADFLLEQQQVDQDEKEQEASLQTDYIRPLGEFGQFEVGYKGDLERLNSRFYSETLDPEESGSFEPDAELNNRFDYTEQIHAGYAILNAEMGDFGAQLGLRPERAQTNFDLLTTGESFDNSYFSFFPSVHLSFAPNDYHTVKLSYSKRVRRPNTWQLNPFTDYEDPTAIRRGNPSLTPEYTHSFETGYTHMAGRYTFSVTPYYRYTVDAITRNEEMTDDGVTVSTFENFATESSSGLELIGTLSLGQWLRANASFNAYRRVTDGNNLETEVASDAFGYSTRMQVSAQLRDGLEMQFSQFYRSPMDVPGGHIDAFTRTDLALQQTLLDDRVRLNVRVSDIFDTMGFNSWRESERYYQESSRNFNAQGIQLSIRYTFGQQERDRRRQQDRGEEPEEGFEEGQMQ